LRASYGAGLIIAVLLPVALLLFGILSLLQMVSAMLLLGGLWTLVFGLFLGAKGDRMYYSGSGVVVALVSTFIVIPIQYTAGLVLIAIIVFVVLSVIKPGSSSSKPAAQT
jgi:predicted membrane protein